MNRESPFSSHELQLQTSAEPFKVDLSRLLRDSPFGETGIHSFLHEGEVAVPAQWTAGMQDTQEAIADEAVDLPAEFDDWFDAREAMPQQAEEFSAEDVGSTQHSDEWAEATDQDGEQGPEDEAPDTQRLDADLSETLFLEPFEAFEVESFGSEEPAPDHYEQQDEAQSEHTCCGGDHP